MAKTTDGAQRHGGTALEGLFAAFLTFGYTYEPDNPDDEPDQLSRPIKLSEEQARQLDESGSVVALPVQTVGPNAKDRERCRLLAESARPRERRESVGRPRPRERRDSSSSRTSGTDPGDDDPAPSPFEPLDPPPAIRGQLSLWGYEPRFGGRR